MAEKRMFSKSIICSDEFLEMPDSTQCLYFHLSMNADDDGFVDKPKAIIRMIGAKEDDLRVLITKSFVLPFDTGIIVIKHWRINNLIRSDRYKTTIYQNELNLLKVDDNGAYTFGEGEIIGMAKKEKTLLTQAQQKRLDAKKESELPYSFEYKIKARFIGKNCPMCGKIMSSYSKKTQPTIQHNLPISKGGKHELDNISIICGECNYAVQDNETGKLNNAEVIEVWNEIKNGNGTGMDTQYSIGKDRLDKNSIEKEKVKKEKFTPPTLEEVKEYAKSRGREDLAIKFFEYFDTGKWIDSEGKPVKNWKQKFITWDNKNQKQQSTKKTESREYSDKQLNDLFDNVSDIQL